MRIALPSPIRDRPLSAWQKVALGAEILATYIQVRWLVARHGVPSAIRMLRRGVRDQHDPERARQMGLRLGGAVERTLVRLPFDTRCLMRSLVLTGLLARRGVHGVVGIGVLTGATFEAHAWVEHEGRALLPTLGHEPLTRL